MSEAANIDDAVGALHGVRGDLQTLTGAVTSLAEQTAAHSVEEGAETRLYIDRLALKVHVLSVLTRVLVVAVIVALVLLGWVIWNQRVNAERFQERLDRNTLSLEQSNVSTARLFDLLDPASEANKQANRQFDERMRDFFAQQECNLGHGCEPGMTPGPIRVPTTTVPASTTTTLPTP